MMQKLYGPVYSLLLNIVGQHLGDGLLARTPIKQRTKPIRGSDDADVMRAILRLPILLGTGNRGYQTLSASSETLSVDTERVPYHGHLGRAKYPTLWKLVQALQAGTHVLWKSIRWSSARLLISPARRTLA